MAYYSHSIVVFHCAMLNVIILMIIINFTVTITTTVIIIIRINNIPDYERNVELYKIYIHKTEVDGYSIINEIR